MTSSESVRKVNRPQTKHANHGNCLLFVSFFNLTL